MKHRRYTPGDLVRVNYDDDWNGLAIVIDGRDEIVTIRMTPGTELAGSKGAFRVDQLEFVAAAPWVKTDYTTATVNLMRDSLCGRSHGRHEARAVA